MIRKQGLRTVLLSQEVTHPPGDTIGEVVAEGLAPGAGPEWRQADKVISLMQLDPRLEYSSLSAGLKRRVLLARGLARDPDLLMLDEPTNHLDLDAICWLETFLLRLEKTVIFVTHDRMFLKNLATRILHLDRGRLTSWSCNYETFLMRRQAALEAEEHKWAVFDKKLAKEEQWIRQGIRARRTRNEGRVRALQRLRAMRRSRQERTGSVRMPAHEGARTGNLVIEAEGVRFGYGGADIVRGFTTTVLRGDKVGIIGPNGSGKTTLLRLLLKELEPGEGRVRHGTHLQVAYFDQLREQLREEESVADNVNDGNPVVTIQGKTRPTVRYLQDFLFTPDRARGPVSFLSGGERNRLLLARLFARPSNVLVLDEPTNDLDESTLELLEELLLSYRGTVLLVSHDRAFLNHVVTAILAFEGEGQINEYLGGYDDWLLHQKRPAASKPEGRRPGKTARGKTERDRHPEPRKRNYKEQQELKALPARIEELEAAVVELQQTLSDPAFYQKEGAEIATARDRLASLEAELKKDYARWEELEGMEG
jgi:ATP-binding cassette subfamily F protein uup